METLSGHFRLFKVTPLPKVRLLDQVRNLLRVRHYSLVTEKSYLEWIRRFIVFHGRQHPETLPCSAISQFLTHLAVKVDVAPSTQNQALNALVFLYREVLNIDVKELPGIESARKKNISRLFSPVMRWRLF